MARFGLAHWHMFEDARSAALASGGELTLGGDHTDFADALPWDVLQATLASPTRTSGSVKTHTASEQTAPLPGT